MSAVLILEIIHTYSLQNTLYIAECIAYKTPVFKMQFL